MMGVNAIIFGREIREKAMRTSYTCPYFNNQLFQVGGLGTWEVTKPKNKTA